MLYIIGLGLGDEKDITYKGLEAVKKANRVYLEEYTSILTVGKRALEAFYERDDLIVADRELVEQGDEILRDADCADVALLVVGDPFGATTHTDLALRAKKAGIRCQIIHNASIMNAIGCTGLQLYSFGETVSIPFWTETWQPDSFYDKIIGNLSRGLHTLCLLDIKVKEPTLESLVKKKREYEPPRFMTVNQAASQLLQIIQRKESSQLSPEKCLSADSICIAVCRVGSSDQKMTSTTLQKVTALEMGPPLHSLVIAGTLHPLEEEYISEFSL
ncbi:diphthine methyl ester synthase [Nilaparvata lugens]|uniref:diphthine methyl ester synthase n=1 Tax=Nilaparvata lugens TaxID=108931 RepID=UPI00193CF6B1|nr:diphthine methyl ester synthase [Nilaparvata lugens]